MSRKTPAFDEELLTEDEMMPNLTNEQLHHQRSGSLENQSLTNNMLQDVKRVYSHPLHSLTKAIERPGYKIVWVTFMENNVVTNANIQEASFKGYYLVPRDRLPNMPMLSDFGLNEIGLKYVIYKDAIAMEIPLEIYNGNYNEMLKLAAQTVRGVKGAKTETGREIAGGLMELDGAGRVTY